MTKQLAHKSAWLVLALMATGCTQALNFKSGPDAAVQSNPSAVCLPGQRSVAKPTKFIFLVDMSGSNVNGPFEHPGVATDPQKDFRYGVINDFLQKNGAKSNLSWEFITFNQTSAHAFINGGNDQQPIFSDRNAMGAALLNFSNLTDVGDTPYKAALDMAGALIKQDMASAGPLVDPALATQYRIAMLTDGYPSDYCPGGISVYNCPGQIIDSRLMSDVQSFVNLAPKAIQLSTVYYGLPDADAANRLKTMAQIGNGQFVDTNVTRVINLDDIIQVPTQICQ